MNINIGNFYELGAQAALLLLLNGIGFLAKRSALDNKWIPFVLVAIGSVIHAFAYDWGGMRIEAQFPRLIAAIIGALIGLTAVGSYELTKTWKSETPVQPPTPNPPPELK